MSGPGVFYTDNSETTANNNKLSFLKTDQDSVCDSKDIIPKKDTTNTGNDRLSESRVPERQSIEDILSQDNVRKPLRKKSSELNDYDLSYNIRESSISGDRPPTRVPSAGRNNHLNGKPTKTKRESSKVGDVEFGDVDDLDHDLADLKVGGPVKPKQIISSVNSKPIDLSTACVRYS